VDAGLVLEAVLDSYVDLRRQTVATRKDWRADDRRKARLDERLPAYDDEDPRRFRVSSPWPTYPEEVASPQMSA